MNLLEHLIVCLNEECVEIAKDTDKALRFGIDDRNFLSPSGPTNRERIVSEINDLSAVLEMCVERGIIPVNWRDESAIAAKKMKVLNCIEYAAKVGALQ